MKKYKVYTATIDNEFLVHYLRGILVTSIILLIISCAVYGQVGATAFQHTKLNYLYVGVDNPITIVSENEFDSISCNNAIVTPTKFAQTTSVVVVINPVDVDCHGNTNLIVFNNGTPIAKNSYRSLLVPLPTVYIANKSEGSIRKEILFVQNGLFAKLDDFEYDLQFEVVSFEMGVESDGVLKVLESVSYSLTERQKSTMRELKSGDVLIFNEIMVKGPGGIRKVAPVILTVE